MTVGGKEAGSAYGFEFPIVEGDCGDLQQVEVLVVGHLFSGIEVRARKVVEVLRIDQLPTVGVGKSCSVVSGSDWADSEISRQASGACPI